MNSLPIFPDTFVLLQKNKNRTMVKIRKYATVEEFQNAIKAAIAKKDLLCSMLRAGASKEELEAAGIHLAPMTK